MGYKDYLKTKEWKLLRNEKYKKSRYTCSICGSKEKLNVHHLFYRSDLADTKPSDLRVLCGRCHKLVHKLIKEGKIVYLNKNHNSMFAIMKHVVKKELGLANKNLFKIKGRKKKNLKESNKKYRKLFSIL